MCTSSIKAAEDTIFSTVYVTIPNNCTGCLQPVGLSVNKPAKEWNFKKGMVHRFAERGMTEEMDLHMSTITAQWMIDWHAHISSCQSIVINGFWHAGIEGYIEQLQQWSYIIDYTTLYIWLICVAIYNLLTEYLHYINKWIL